MTVFVEFDDLSDEELVSRIQKGEGELFSVLARRHLPLIRYLATQFSAYNIETDDLIQEGTIALYRAVYDYREGETSFVSFAGLCIRRAFSDERKMLARKRRIPPSQISSLDEQVGLSDVFDPEKILIQREDYETLAHSIRLELSEMEYKVLSEFLQGHSYADISERLSLSSKSVDNALRRIRTKLKDKNSV